MYIFELVQPGTWLEAVDDDLKQDVESLLRLLTECVENAAIALSLFDESQQSMVDSLSDQRATWEADRERERLIESQLQQNLPPNLDAQARWDALSDISELARHEAKREKWRSGHMPDGYRHRLPFLHAKSFVYALDTLQKSMELLARTAGMPTSVGDALAGFRAAFPDLVHVRDSSHHAEDRVQGKKYGKRIELKPLENVTVRAPDGGVLIVDMLNGRRYGGTLGDGSYGEVDVSLESLAIAGRSVQCALDAFSWSGPKTHLPR